jgi:hypothetical protein
MSTSEKRTRRFRAGALATFVAAAALLPACAPGSVSVGVGVAVPAPWGSASLTTAMPPGPPGPYGGSLWW